jgi:hypothetical protein
MGLDCRYPFKPASRASSLRIRHAAKVSNQIAAHDDLESTISVSTELAARLESEAPKGLGLIKCRINPDDEERFELAFDGFGAVEATDDEIGSYYIRKLGDEARILTFQRCIECENLPIRRKLAGSGFTVHSDFDFLLLSDFGGKYVSERGRELLEGISPGSFIFEPV